MRIRTHTVKQSDILYISISLLLFAIALILIHPVLEMGLNDDWSYIYTARELALKGKLTYNGWASAMMVPQACWAALFVKLFGFSFTIVRVSTMVPAALCLPLLYGVSRQAGLNRGLAFFSTAFVSLSPVFLPEAVSYMTDVPGFFFFILCLWAALRAARASNFKTVAAWLAVVLVTGILAGTTRQIYWIAPLLFFPFLGCIRRRERLTILLVALAFFIEVGVLVATNSWFHHQLYSLSDATEIPLSAIARRPIRVAYWFARVYEPLCLFLFPLLASFVAFSWRVLQRKYWLTGAAILLAVLFVAEKNPNHRPPDLGNTVTAYGFLPPHTEVWGEKPTVLSGAVRGILAVLVFTSLAAFVSVALKMRNQLRHLFISDSSGRFFAILTLPFAIISVLATAARVTAMLIEARGFPTVYDRYAIPLLPIAGILALRLYQEWVADRVEWVSWAALLVFAVFSVVVMHDAFSVSRARFRAANTLTRNGMSRSSILGGVEYDGWTEIETTGHVNDDQIYPRSAFRKISTCTGPPDVQYLLRAWTPDVKPRYFVVLSRLPNLIDSPFGAIDYSTWLPPRHRRIFIEMLPHGEVSECR